MVPPPIAAGYWLAGVGGVSVLIVVLAIIKELCSTNTYNQKIDKDREALRGPMTWTPHAPRLLPSTDNLIFQKSQFLAFTCPYQLSESLIKPTEERKLIRSFFEKIDIDVETVIPKGARTVSYAYDGFEFGDSCLDFRPKSGPENGPESLEEPEFRKFTYQMICSRVQNVYCNDILAGTCLYFDTDDNDVITDKPKRFSEVEYNLMAFYDTVTQKTRQEVRETRKFEKLARKAQRSAEEPLKEYTSTVFSHLRLFTEENGTTVVLACNADGKMEKYAFNEEIDRYEYVETEEINEEQVADNFLVRRY